jgi:hypothetical protein
VSQTASAARTVIDQLPLMSVNDGAQPPGGEL